MMKTKEQYRQILEARLDESRLKMLATGAALGAAIGAGAGVATPHISAAKVDAMRAAGDPAGISNIETAKQGVRDRIGLGANTPATTRGAVGAGIFAPIGAGVFAFRKKRR